MLPLSRGIMKGVEPLQMFAEPSAVEASVRASPERLLAGTSGCEQEVKQSNFGLTLGLTFGLRLGFDMF